MAAGVDVNTQQSFEALNQRAVAVVVDPIQSVKGKVVIDAVKYTKSSVTLGVALQLSLSKIDAKSNDDIKSWCLATKGYGTSGLKGTPGTENLPCK